MKKILLIITFLFWFHAGNAQREYQPSAENLKAREWFKDAKFGMFIHWGVYSILGDGEWVMNNQNIAIENYEKLPRFFNPIEFDAEEWVRLAKNAGMKYITVTTRHHDGFSMFDTKASTYDIVDATPFKRDIIKELADACHKEGIKLFFYYSLLDWRHEDYYPKGRTGTGIPDKTTSGDWEEYIGFMKIQLRELLTNYGEIGGIWFDGHWDKADADWNYDELYSLIHNLQPQALIGNNHHQAPIAGEDFQMFERDLPGKNETGFGTDPKDIGNLPKEVCATINGSWGFNLQDRKHKSEKELVRYLIKSAGFGSNLLLNVGPMPNGEIQEEHKKSLKKIGDWLDEYGDLIYGSKQGPVPPSDEMVSTQKEGRIFLYVFSEEDIILIKDLPETARINYYDTKEEVGMENTSYGAFLEISEENRGEIATILEIKYKE